MSTKATVGVQKTLQNITVWIDDDTAIELCDPKNYVLRWSGVGDECVLEFRNQSFNCPNDFYRNSHKDLDSCTNSACAESPSVKKKKLNSHFNPL